MHVCDISSIFSLYSKFQYSHLKTGITKMATEFCEREIDFALIGYSFYSCMYIKLFVY